MGSYTAHELFNLLSRSIYKPHSVKRAMLALAIISLGHALPHGSSGLPETLALGLAPKKLRRRAASYLWGWTASTLWNCLCLALLPTGVAWLRPLPVAPVVSYTAFSPLPGLPGGLFLWPDPAGCPAPGVARRRALWSADFPLKFRLL